jgi:four helix bundle protein
MATAHRFEDLIAWQLSEAVKEEVFRLTSRERVRRDTRFCDDIQRSARSAPANIAEGFGRFEPKPNANYVSIAKASLEETRNHTYDGFKRNHFDIVERDELLQLLKRAIVATTRLLRYLKSCKQAPSGNIKARTRDPEPGNPEPGNKNPRNRRNPRTREPS